MKDVPETEYAQPPGVIAVNIDPMTGLREPSGSSRTLEFFYQEAQPPVGEGALVRDANRPAEEVRNQIF